MLYTRLSPILCSLHPQYPLPTPKVRVYMYSHRLVLNSIHLQLLSSTHSDNRHPSTSHPCYCPPEAEHFRLPLSDSPFSSPSSSPFEHHPISCTLFLLIQLSHLYHRHHFHINFESPHPRLATSSANQKRARSTTSSDPRMLSSFSVASVAKIARRPRRNQRQADLSKIIS